MINLLKSVPLGTGVILGTLAIASAPTLAASLTNAIVTGSAPYLTYGANSVNTFLVPNSGSPTWANERAALTGDITSPTGNIELFANSEALTKAEFDAYTDRTNLEGQIGGQNLVLSSLTAADWQTILPATGKTLALSWFEDVWVANGLGEITGGLRTFAFNTFVNNGGLQRFSDPNISYVNQDDTTGLIRIGLAGHLNARDFIAPYLSDYHTELLPEVVTASEVVKYTYNGQQGYLFGTNVVPSGLTEISDGRSHNGTYEVTLPGIPGEPTTVPEPTTVLALLGVGSLLATQKKRLQP